MSRDPLPATGFDPLDTASGIPYAGYAQLRREAPVSRTPSGVVFLALQEDVLAAARAEHDSCEARRVRAKGAQGDLALS